MSFKGTSFSFEGIIGFFRDFQHGKNELKQVETCVSLDVEDSS